MGSTGTSRRLTKLERQGSFYVGGREVTASGKFDATISALPDSRDQTFWVDQMYVQYQIPPRARRLPIVLVHGGRGTGRARESTPDGREGYQTIFLRRGFPVYIVDTLHGGRSGYPGFTGEFGKPDKDIRVVPSHTFRVGREIASSRWRLSPRNPDVFANQAFPMSEFHQFLRHMRPVVAANADLVSGAPVSLLDTIGPAIPVTHSNSGVWGWLCAARSSNVQVIVSYES